MDTADHLAAEARVRPRAAAAAMAAALLTIGGGIYSGVQFADVPKAQILDSLGRVVQPGAIGGVESLRVPLYAFYDERFGQLLIGAGLSGLGALCIGATLTFLAYATRARRPEFPRAALYIPLIGGALLSIALLMVAFGTSKLVDGIIDGPRTVDAIRDVDPNTLLSTGQLIEVAGRFTIGAAFVLVCLNAMRVGLLTRFMGVLGIIAGVLFALPIFGGPLPVVQVFWLFATGLLLAGFWPNGIPRAWTTGQAIPWPSGAELREARVAAAEERRLARGGEPKDEPEPEPEPAPAARSHPASKKRKRKRRG